MTDPEANLDPLLRRLLAAARDADTEPDDTALAEHLVARLIGGPGTRESRIRAACVDSAVRQRAFYRNCLATMQRRLARVVAGAEDPATLFERLLARDAAPEE